MKAFFKRVSSYFIIVRKNKGYFFYTLIILAFAIWMLFLDTHSWRIHSELNDEMEKLELQKKTLQKAVEEDRSMLEKLGNKDSLEHFAREEYGYKKEGESVFYIEFEDSIP